MSKRGNSTDRVEAIPRESGALDNSSQNNNSKSNLPKTADSSSDIDLNFVRKCFAGLIAQHDSVEVAPLPGAAKSVPKPSCSNTIANPLTNADTKPAENASPLAKELTNPLPRVTTKSPPNSPLNTSTNPTANNSMTSVETDKDAASDKEDAKQLTPLVRLGRRISLGIGSFITQNSSIYQAPSITSSNKTPKNNDNKNRSNNNRDTTRDKDQTGCLPYCLLNNDTEEPFQVSNSPEDKSLFIEKNIRESKATLNQEEEIDKSNLN